MLAMALWGNCVAVCPAKGEFIMGMEAIWLPGFRGA
jgi:hypothetical protein